MAKVGGTNFIASDATSQWRKMVKSASTSIVIFSPFLDGHVKSLLDCSALPNGAKTVVTDLSPETGAVDYLAQLKTLKKLIGMGVGVRSLRRLHAKVLWIDEGPFSVGSQNFTNYARGSKETTGFRSELEILEPIQEDLRQWLAESEPVTLVLVEALIRSLSTEAMVLEKAHVALVRAFEDEMKEVHARLEVEATEQKEREAAERLARLLQLQAESEFQLAQSQAFGRLRKVPNGLFDSYRTMLIESGSDLTRWRRSTRARNEVMTLGSRSFFPLLLADTTKMGFARVAKTRITYVRSFVAGNNFALPGYPPGKFSVDCPAVGTQNVNLTFAFERPNSDKYVYDCFFDGANLNLVSQDFAPAHEWSRYAEEFAVACEAQLTIAKNQKRIFAELSNFRFSELGIRNKNADQFFEQGWYSFGAITFAETPVLVAKKHL